MNLKPSKRWEVEVFTHKNSGRKITIYYNKDHKIFWSPVGTEIVKGATQVEVKIKAVEIADAKLVHEDRWERILIVEPTAPRSQTRYSSYKNSSSFESPAVGFSCWRAWIMETWDGKHLTRNWDRNPTDRWDRERIEKNQDIQPFSDYSSKKGVILAYSDELWTHLQNLGARIGDLQKQLSEMLTSPLLETRLRQEIPGLLPAKKEE